MSAENPVMTQKFTVEEVLAEAQYVRAYSSNNPGTESDWGRNADMLTAYAERIEADESAVPAAEIEHFVDRVSEMRMMPEAILLGIGKHKLFTHPPAQAAQVDRARETPRRQQAVETLLELGWQYNTERGWEEPAPPHPHSPDAADSGRVTPYMMEKLADAAAALDKLGRRNQCVHLMDLHAALVAHGKGESTGGRRCPACVVCGDDMVPNRPSTAPPASPAGVPDGMALVPRTPTIEMVAAGHDTYLGAPNMACFGLVWKAMLAAAPSQPEGAA